MRHGRKINHLGRTSSHRKAMMANMACSLIEHKRINTTLAKAKALRKYVEPLLTKSKNDSTHTRRTVFSYLQNKDIVAELFRDVAPKIAERNGGYTRILKTGNRLGDNAEMCFIELVDFNETYISDKKDKKTTRRSRRGGSKPAETTTATKTESPAAAKTEAKSDEAPAAEVKAEAKTEEAVVEEVKAEVKSEETPVEEVKAEAKTEEAPAAEIKEEPKEESKEDSASDEDEKKDEEKS